MNTTDTIPNDNTPADDTPVDHIAAEAAPTPARSSVHESQLATAVANSSAQDAPEEESGRDPLQKARNEAKNLRDRLKAAEADRDALNAQLDGLRRAEAARLATGPGKLGDGNDLFTAGIDVSELLEDGVLSPELIGAAVNKVLAEHPGWAAQRPPAPSRQPVANLHPGATPVAVGDGTSASWQQALRGY